MIQTNSFFKIRTPVFNVNYEIYNDFENVDVSIYLIQNLKEWFLSYYNVYTIKI